MNKRKILPYTKEQLFELFVQKDYTVQELADLCGCGIGLIKDALHSTGLNLKEKRAYKRYYLDETCFKNITEEVAYILGYFYTMAEIDNKLNTIRVTVRVEDKNVLEKMCNHIFKINTDYFINKSDGKEKLLVINNKKVKNDYTKLGYMKENVISINDKIENLTEELQRSFFRGYLEANGRLNFSLNKQLYTLVLEGDSKMLQTFQKTILEKNNLKKNKIQLVTPKCSEQFYRYRTTNDIDICGIYKYLYRENDELYSDKHLDKFKDVFYNRKYIKVIG